MNGDLEREVCETTQHLLRGVGGFCISTDNFLITVSIFF